MDNNIVIYRLDIDESKVELSAMIGEDFALDTLTPIGCVHFYINGETIAVSLDGEINCTDFSVIADTIVEDEIYELEYFVDAYAMADDEEISLSSSTFDFWEERY